MFCVDQIFLRWIRFCLNCGKYDPPIRNYCDECWCNLLSLIHVRTHKISPDFKVITLIDWSDEHYDLVSSFVLAQKNSGLGNLIVQLIEWNILDILLEIKKSRISGSKFSYNLERSIAPFEHLTLLPIPSRLNIKDHAYKIANAVSNNTGLLLVPNLLVKLGTASQISQKFRRKEERRNLEFAVNQRKNFNGYALIIDDVITTGSTMLAAKNALNAPNAIGFALVNRFQQNNPNGGSNST